MGTHTDFEGASMWSTDRPHRPRLLRLDGTPSAIAPLDKVEPSDLGSLPSPQGAFCSSHWSTSGPVAVAAVGFHGGGTQVLDVRRPRAIRSYGHAVRGASEVWDSM